MNNNLLALIRTSVCLGYLPENWHDNKEYVVKTATGYYSLALDCIKIQGAFYHEGLDHECYRVDFGTSNVILSVDCIEVINGVGTVGYAHRDRANQFFQYCGHYYTATGLNANDLVEMADGTIALRSGVYYWDSDNEYHYDRESREDENDDWNSDHDDDEDDGVLWDYHNGPVPPDYRSSCNEPGIGFEIEKGGDPEFCGFGDRCYMFQKTGCVMERDGSVDWELKTPIYPLFSERIEDEWLPLIRHAIEAENHDQAGGHINLSLPPKNGKQLFDYCRPYLPVFMAMYPKRLEVDFCKGKPECALKRDDQKHQAIKIWDDRIEMRFPAKVFDMKALLFRLNFCRQMITKEYKSIPAATIAAFDRNTGLYKLIMTEYKGKEYLLLSRIMTIAKDYFNTDLRKERAVAALLKILKNQKSCVSQS